MDEYILIELDMNEFKKLRKQTLKYKILRVYVKDDLFSGDETHKNLASVKRKANKELIKYEQNKRNGSK